MTRRIALIAGFAALVLALLAGLALIVTTPITIETCSAVQVEGGEFEETCTTDRERGRRTWWIRPDVPEQ